jgi:histidyl-tRNA synthetase
MEFIADRLAELCDDCKRRSTTNPLRVLDCKKPGCREQVKDAPSMVDYLCSSCSEHFAEVRSGLDQLGVAYTLNKFMVRGLDYYVRTTFEFVSDQLGAQSAVCAGGRYDGLIELLGGGKVPGIGFAMGIERLVLILQQQEGDASDTAGLELFCAGLGPDASRFCFGLTHELRRLGVRVDMDLEARSLKSQMKQADRAKAAYVLIVGDQEMESGSGILRNMQTKEQVEINLDTAAVFKVIERTSGN